MQISSLDQSLEKVFNYIQIFVLYFNQSVVQELIIYHLECKMEKISSVPTLLF